MGPDSEARSLARALELARAGDTMFGAVLVSGGEIVAEACNTVRETGDPNAHAELSVIRSYCRERRVPTLSGCTPYTTAEPCPIVVLQVRRAVRVRRPF